MHMYKFLKPEPPKPSAWKIAAKLLLVVGAAAGIGYAAYVIYKKYKENMCALSRDYDDDFEEYFDGNACCETGDVSSCCCCEHENASPEAPANADDFAPETPAPAEAPPADTPEN